MHAICFLQYFKNKTCKALKVHVPKVLWVFFLFNQMQCYTSILLELMYGFLFIKKGKHGFAFVTFFKNFIEKWFSSSASVYMFQKYTYVVWHTAGLQEDVCSYCTYVTTATRLFYKQFILPRTKLIWIFSFYRICQIGYFHLQDNTFQLY